MKRNGWPSGGVCRVRNLRQQFEEYVNCDAAVLSPYRKYDGILLSAAQLAPLLLFEITRRLINAVIFSDSLAKKPQQQCQHLSRYQITAGGENGSSAVGGCSWQYARNGSTSGLVGEISRPSGNGMVKAPAADLLLNHQAVIGNISPAR